jgi:hypothetical protein
MESLLPFEPLEILPNETDRKIMHPPAPWGKSDHGREAIESKELFELGLVVQASDQKAVGDILHPVEKICNLVPVSDYSNLDDIKKRFGRVRIIEAVDELDCWDYRFDILFVNDKSCSLRCLDLVSEPGRMTKKALSLTSVSGLSSSILKSSEAAERMTLCA